MNDSFHHMDSYRSYSSISHQSPCPILRCNFSAAKVCLYTYMAVLIYRTQEGFLEAWKIAGFKYSLLVPEKKGRRFYFYGLLSCVPGVWSLQLICFIQWRVASNRDVNGKFEDDNSHDWWMLGRLVMFNCMLFWLINQPPKNKGEIRP